MSNFIIGVDGGASKTNAVLLDKDGKILLKESTAGTNLTISQNKAPQLLLDLIIRIIKNAGILKKDISAIGLGLAGASNEDGRDLVFKAFDSENLSNRLLICSDAESAYRLTCPTNEGIMLSVGTGIICIGRDKAGNLFRTAGKGHFQDKGSAYWIGDQILWQLSISESNSYSITEMNEILNLIFSITDENDFESALKSIMNSENRISQTAQIAEGICAIAEKNNFAINILQEATREAGEYILEIRDMMQLYSDEIILAGNGSLLRNSIYRKNLNSALEFDFNKIIWTFSELDPEIGSTLLAAEFVGISLSISDILDNNKSNA